MFLSASSLAVVKCALHITLALKLLRKKCQYVLLNEKLLIIKCISDMITAELQN